MALCDCRRAGGEGKGYVFVDEIKGGVIPREFIPSVDKGYSGYFEGRRVGWLPGVDVKVRLTFGSYHDVGFVTNRV